MKELVKSWLPSIVLFWALVTYDQYSRERIKPAPKSEFPQSSSPVALAAWHYKLSLPTVYHAAAVKVRNHEFQDKKAIGEYLQAAAKPAADALDVQIDPFVGPDGKFTDPSAVADALDQAYVGLR